MPNTTNFNWATPADTDLVKDGAAAIRTLGNSIDSSFVDLKGGTTGQILSKASNTDLDYTWIANDVGDITAVTAGTGISGGGTSGAVTITNSMATEITAKGDLIVGTGSGTFDNLPAGTNGYTLVADSSVSPTGLKWAAPSSGALTLITQASFDNPNVSVSNCFSTTYENYLILINCDIVNATARQVFLRFLDSGGSEYSSSNYYGSAFGYKTSGATLQQTQGNGAAQINFPTIAQGSQNAYFVIHVQRRASTNGANPSFTGTLFNAQAPSDSNAASYTIGGMFDSSSTVYGFKFYNGTYNVAGNYRVYGYQKS